MDENPTLWDGAMLPLDEVKPLGVSVMSLTVEGRPMGDRLSITSLGVFR